MINVTKTYLPDFDKYAATLRRAWDKSWITNNGELVQELEQRLKEFLGVKHLFYTTNGTIVLQMALKAFGIKGEVITTPFSYVATTNAILWEDCKPVFADIDQSNYCIDAGKIEALITENTQAILATHVYGLPCNVDAIAELAARYRLKVIYDGAHAFGCRLNGKSLLNYGDISTCSFHATKVFHTVEGGCIITEDDDVARRIMLFRQFGHVNDDYYSVGINAKNSEFHAAMGLNVLDDFTKIVQYRKEVFNWYNALLDNKIYRYPVTEDSFFTYNYSYYPLLFENENQLLKVRNALLEKQVNTRRYFYPSLNTLPFVNAPGCPVSEDYALRVLCLPLYYGLSKAEITMICDTINENI